jgi:hypothetical protein
MIWTPPSTSHQAAVTLRLPKDDTAETYCDMVEEITMGIDPDAAVLSHMYCLTIYTDMLLPVLGELKNAGFIE